MGMSRTLRNAAIIAVTVVGVASTTLAGQATRGVVPSFVEETQSSGIDSTYTGDWQYIVGGGVATFDCNGSGFPDLLLAGGEKPAKFYLNQSTRGGPLKFKEQPSGLELTNVIGAYPIDIDGDGIMDVVLLRQGETVIMRGLGDCKFERANEAWNFTGGNLWWTAFSATWEHGATWPTVAMGSYISTTKSIDVDPWGSCTGSVLMRPNATNTGFADAVPLKPSYCPLSMLFTDWNRSGTPSLRVSNDREYYRGGSEQLFHIEPGKPPAPYTAEEGWKPLKIWGMSIASTVNAQGYPEYFLSSMADNKLQVLASAAPGSSVRPDYQDVALPLNALAQRPYTGGDVHPSTAWHAQFADVNNDGFPDLFIAKGNVSDMPDFAMKDPDNLLLGGPDGKFVEVGGQAGVASMNVGRGAALADFNLDGLPDLIVVNRNHQAQIFRNVTKGAGHWLDLELSEPGANRNAIGAWVEVKAGSLAMTREITTGGGHVSGQQTWIHFGLAEMTDATVQVTWPDGSKSDVIPVKADSFYILSPGQPPQVWVPQAAGG